MHSIANKKVAESARLSNRGGVEDTRLEAKDSPTEDKPSRGQGPRTQAQVLSKKKGLQKKNFCRSPEKTVFQKIFQAFHKLLTTQKIVLSSNRGQGNFRGL